MSEYLYILHVYECTYMYVFKNTEGMYSMIVQYADLCMLYILQCSLLCNYLEEGTKSVLLIRGTYFQYWLT